MRTSTIILNTLVDVLASPTVFLQLVSFGTGTVEGAIRVETSVRAAGLLDRAFVDILTVFAIVIQLESRRTLAKIITFGVDAGVTARVRSVGALVHISARLLVVL